MVIGKLNWNLSKMNDRENGRSSEIDAWWMTSIEQLHRPKCAVFEMSRTVRTYSKGNSHSIRESLLWNLKRFVMIMSEWEGIEREFSLTQRNLRMSERHRIIIFCLRKILIQHLSSGEHGPLAKSMTLHRPLANRLMSWPNRDTTVFFWFLFYVAFKRQTPKLGQNSLNLPHVVCRTQHQESSANTHKGTYAHNHRLLCWKNGYNSMWLLTFCYQIT